MSKTAHVTTIGQFWMTKTAHTEVQNGPHANRNDPNGPKLKRSTVMSRTARVVFRDGKITSSMYSVHGGVGTVILEFYCKIFGESATEKISKMGRILSRYSK